MIIDPPDGKNLEDFVYIDIGRPSFTTDTEREWWLGFHNWVEETEIPIMINQVFFRTLDLLEKGGSTLGSGYKYYFAVHTQEEADVFKKKWPDAWQPDRMVYHFWEDENGRRHGKQVETDSEEEKKFLGLKQFLIEKGSWKDADGWN